MITTLELISSGTALVTVPKVSICYGEINLDGAIKTLVISVPTAVTGTNAIFNLLINGVAQFTGTSRPKILIGNRKVTVSSLDIAVAADDIVSIDLETVDATGIASPIIAKISYNITSTTEETAFVNAAIAAYLLANPPAPSPYDEDGFKRCTLVNKVGCTQGFDGNLQKTSVNAGWGTAGAVSSDFIADTGVIRLVIRNQNQYMAGLAYADVNQNYTSINYAWNIGNGNAQVYESGAAISVTTPAPAGELFYWEVYRDGSNQRCLRYIKDTTVLRTVSNIAAGNLYFDIALYGGLAAMNVPRIKIT
jgi:hypothetical protein